MNEKFSDIAWILQCFLNYDVFLEMSFKPLKDYNIGEVMWQNLF